MKQCPYCGKEYPDDAVVCAADQTELVPFVPKPPPAPVAPKHQTITVRRFTAGSLFKIIAIGCVISLFGFSLLMVFFALLGAHTVHWNRESVTGAAGLMQSVWIGGILAVAFTILGWIGFTISFWLFSMFGSVKLHYIADEKASQPKDVSA